MKLGIQNVPSTVNLPYKDGLSPVRIIVCEMTEALDLQEVEWYRQPGEDAAPPIGSTILIIEIGDDWKIGFACDDGIVPEVLEGERETYASVGGQKFSRIKQAIDGSIEIEANTVTAPTTIKLNIDGSIEINSIVASIKLNVDGSTEISGNTDFAALASKVDEFILKLDTLLRTTWKPIAQDGGAALQIAYLAAFATPPLTVASQKLKLGG